MTEATVTKREARAAAAAERAAEREHEVELTKLVLSWLGTTTPKRGDILVLTVPAEYFPMPGTPQEEITPEQMAMMEHAHTVFRTCLQQVERAGILLGGACLIGEGMRLEDMPPPWEKHPDAQAASERIVTPGKRILLPPGTKI